MRFVQCARSSLENVIFDLCEYVVTKCHLQVDYEENDQCQEKTMCAATDEFMDMTQSHTSNIASGPLAPQQMAAGGLDSEFKHFLSSLSKSSGPSANPAITRMTPATEALSVTLQDCEGLKRVEKKGKV